MQGFLTTLLTWAALLAVPAGLAWIGKHVRSDTLRGAVNDAAARAGGIAYAFLQSQTAIGGNPSMNNAIDQGVDHLRTSLPGAIAALGIAGPVLANMVKGELGKLLAADPNVSVGPAVRR